MASFTLDVRGLEGLLKKLEAKADLREEASAIVQGTAKEIARDAKNKAPFDFGRLMGQIQPNDINDLTSEVVSPSKYSAVMEWGTKKRMEVPDELKAFAQQFQGKLQGGTFKELLRAITAWVGRKGLSGTYSVKTRKRTGKKANRQDEDLAVAYPIALSIAKNGVRPHHFFFPAYFKGRARMIEEFKELIRR
jgi:hypothetical protein